MTILGLFLRFIDRRWRRRYRVRPDTVSEIVDRTIFPRWRHLEMCHNCTYSDARWDTMFVTDRRSRALSVAASDVIDDALNS